MGRSKHGKISTILCTLGLLFVTCFYSMKLNEALIFYLGTLLFFGGVFYTVKSFVRKGKGVWKFSPTHSRSLYFRYFTIRYIN
ncbi:uncharacterized membrane protein HdeD (DUF308 family) [Peribacillus deserti]|uniref:Uncharacterized membrane protein HdeD (DUF308 family) n=1 Tax=Peribacillus deserti TaxID=673318 RepID=A0ABS2QP95_9BACI|nr:uncharacterized membrane protein HdeD (DUF308 family) [Peribacillus deserti]